MHTDASWDILSQATVSLSNSIQNFQDKTCTMFQTQELERERDARQRRLEKKTAKCGTRLMPATSSDSTGEPMNHRTEPTPTSNSVGESTSIEERRSISTH